MSWLDEDKPWYVYYAGEMRGPITPHDALRLAGEGKLKADDLVWTVGYPDWRPAQDVQGLYLPPPLPKMPAKTDSGRGPEKKPSRTPTPPLPDPSGERLEAVAPERNGATPPAEPPLELTETMAVDDEPPPPPAEALTERNEPLRPKGNPALSSADFSGETSDVKEVLKALLTEPETSASLQATPVSSSKARKEGLLDQIVKRIRDQEDGQPSLGAPTATPSARKGP